MDGVEQMVKCEFCNSVYNNNETKCTLCGAALPISKDNTPVYEDNFNKNRAYKNNDDGLKFGLIKYADLSQVQAIEFDVTGRECRFSIEEPIIVDGMVTNYDEYRNNMQVISLSNAIVQGVNFDLFVNLKVLIDHSGNVIEKDSYKKLPNLLYLELRPRETFEKVPNISKLEGLCLLNSQVKAIDNIDWL